MLKFFDRYILREVAPPFGIGLLLCTFVLLMKEILALPELIISQGFSLGFVAKSLLYLIPSLLALAVPMAVLIGILAGLSRLSTDSEITAFRTLGISSRRLARPIFVFALAGWLVTSCLTLFLAPRAGYKREQSITSAVLAKVQVRIVPREFNVTMPNMVLYIQEVDRDKTWRNVFVYLTKDPAEPQLILAREGRIDLFPETKKATLILTDGMVHSYPLNQPEKYSITSFKRLEEGINVGAFFSPISGPKRVREMDILELQDGVRRLDADLAAVRASAHEVIPTVRAATSDVPPNAQSPLKIKSRELRAHWVEIHKRFALPFVCFIFVLLGIPLGMTTKKGGRSSGFTISIAVILLYYILITAGEKLAMDGRVPPFLGMWGPNIILFAAGVYLFVKSLRETALFSGLAGFLRRRGAGAGPTPRPRRSGPRLPRIPVRFPNILDRYIIRKYLFLFALIFVGLVSVSIIVTFFERIGNVYAHDKPLPQFFQYIWARVPEFAFFTLPVAALMTTLLALGILTKFNEVTAMKACGISLYRIILPILFMALAASLSAFYIQESILPRANNRAEEIWNRINDAPSQSYSNEKGYWILGQERNRIYRYAFFDSKLSAFSRLSVFDIDLASWSLAGRSYAAKAVLAGETLRMDDGWTRSFSGDRATGFRTDAQAEITGIEKKDYFLKEWKEPSQMTFAELRAYTAEVADMGFDTTRFRVDLHEKIAFPFVCLVMTLLGIPFAFSMGRKGALVGIGLSVVIAMVYWGAIGVFRSLGYISYLAPFLAAWTPNLVFGLAGIYLLFRLRT